MEQLSLLIDIRLKGEPNRKTTKEKNRSNNCVMNSAHEWAVPRWAVLIVNSTAREQYSVEN
jgi:hypothetical protein